MDQRKPRKIDPKLDGGELWGLDPRDVQFHARRMRQARAVGPLGKFFRFGAVALVIAGAVTVYLNRETLRGLRFDSSALTSVFSGGRARNAEDGGEPGTEVVEDTTIAGVNLPTSLDGEAPPEAEARAADAPTDDAAPAAPAPTTAAAAPPADKEPEPSATEARPAAVEAPPAPAVPPEPVREEPVGPETFGFGLSTMNVSEADASAAVLVLRDGGRRGVSFITWWTTDGTANAGADFARLEPRVERFGVGEQNRAIYVPIIGDRNVEGPENFYVHVAVGESASVEPVARIEVVIVDDDSAR